MANSQHVELVKKGAVAIAEWRESHEQERIDLADADLTDIDLTGANLTGANLSRAKLIRANLTDADLSRADLSGTDLTDATLERTDFTDADLTNMIDVGEIASRPDLSSEAFAVAHACERESLSPRQRTVGYVRCKSAMQFLISLYPLLGTYSSSAPPNRNLYRGHSRTDYQLTPSVLRKTLPFEIQINTEILALSEFFRFADAEGLAIPGDSQWVRNRLDRTNHVHDYIERVLRYEEQWPPDEMLPLLAIAQHSGVKTRLLDWSREPLVAAYFAAISTAQQIIDGKSGNTESARICVWVLNWEPIDHVSHITRSQKLRIKFVTVPASSNRNLHAQKGMFTLVEQFIPRPKGEGDNVIDYVSNAPLNVAVEKVYPAMRTGFQAPLTCVTLPAEQAPHLLFCLGHLRVSAASIFPGFEGVARAISETKLWPRGVVDPRGEIDLRHLESIAWRDYDS